ncbi:MAG: hypothetical protein AAGD11_00995 [Planctomycetota bacterium]
MSDPRKKKANRARSDEVERPSANDSPEQIPLPGQDVFWDAFPADDEVEQWPDEADFWVEPG